ncbi:trichohyalin [Drosophila albomicans]|uniref:Trichohyalin n=1 Tax=Drosophila albomicans TaxID=7291 RepID=A0A6P8WPW7_DROAB|nr:trichohyalin [Drosophila albomicans]
MSEYTFKMSQLKFEENCNLFDLAATENLFSKLSCSDKVNKQRQQLNEESFLSGIERFGNEDDERSTRLSGLEQVQRRSSIVYESAQLKAAALQNLLKTFDSSWLNQQPKPVASTAQQRPAPQAYGFKEIYERKKQQLLHQCLEQERTQRQFHSRPMPNFRQVHEQHANKLVVHRITHPVSPNVLKKSRQMLLKRDQKVEQFIQQRELDQRLEQQLRPRTKPVPKSRPAPLKPHNRPTIAQSIMKPFRLSTELRAEQRKQFNAQSQLAQENRRRELEAQRKRAEHEEYLKQRQLATFRARPNPFRNH